MLLLIGMIMLHSPYIQTASSQNATNSSIGTNSTISNVNATRNFTVINAVGDIDCSKKLVKQIKKDNPDLFVVLGDLCYKSDLDYFKETYGDLKNKGKLTCLMGNHEDDKEDGNPIIDKQTLEYCGDYWYRKVANNTTLLIGLNTNGDTTIQTEWGKSLVTNSTLMDGVKNILFLSHKPAHTPFESHHPVENSTLEMITGIEKNISKSIQVYKIGAHNHFMAESRHGYWYITGGGGRSHHDGTATEEWPFVNTKKYGYLQIMIDNQNGTVSTNFYGVKGKFIY